MSAVIDLDNVANSNFHFRKVLYTTHNAQMQVVVMTLWPNERIGMEVHPQNTQVVYVQSGEGVAILNGQQWDIYPGMAVVIDAGTQHDIVNTSDVDMLQFTVLYSPAIHPANEINWANPDVKLRRDSTRPAQPMMLQNHRL